MDIEGVLRDIRSSPGYRGQIVHVHEVPARPGEYASDPPGLSDDTWRMLAALGVERLYSHQAEAIRALRAGHDVLIVTGAAVGFLEVCSLVWNMFCRRYGQVRMSA